MSADRLTLTYVFLLMIIAVVVCLAQLTAVTSWTRSVRFTTLVLAAVVGCYGCGFVAVALEWLLTRGWHRLAGGTLAETVRVASWTTDPVIEEIVKVLPVVLVLVVGRRLGRQLGFTDLLLLGAALGTGFALFEAALRYSTVRFAVPVPGGFLVAAGLGGTVTVPSPLAAILHWLPAPATSADLFGSANGDQVQHLVWTALATVGLAWVFRHRGQTRWLGLLLLLLVTVDHMNYNARVATERSGPASDAMAWVGAHLGALLLITMVLATVVDRVALARGRAQAGSLLLTGEPANGLNPTALLRYAVVAPRWTVSLGWRFALARRAALYAADSGTPDATLTAEVADVRDRMERTGSAELWTTRLSSSALISSARALVRSPRTWLWVVLLLPAVVYLVLGGFPWTRDLQHAMEGTVGLALGVAAALGATVLLTTQLPGLARRLGSGSSALHLVRGHVLLRLTAVGALLGCGASVLAVAVASVDQPGGTVVSNYHALDALGRLLVIAGIMVFLWGLIMFPPLTLTVVVTAEGLLVPVEVGLTLTGELGLVSAASAGLGLTGIALQQADENAGSSGSGRGSSSSGSGANRTPTDRAKEHLTDRDLDAARRELNGEVVARKSNGKPWDHVQEVRETQAKLTKRIRVLQRMLGDPRLSESERTAAQQELSEASRLLDYSRKFVPR